jgi:hypothetical protein
MPVSQRIMTYMYVLGSDIMSHKDNMISSSMNELKEVFAFQLRLFLNLKS